MKKKYKSSHIAGPFPWVLILDDDPLFRKSLSLLLQDEYRCITASNGSEGLEKFIEFEPDLVLCDVKMEEDHSGFRVCRQLKQLNPKVPIILLSNYSGQQSRLAGLAAGADDYIGKFSENEELLLRVRNALVSSGRIKYSSESETNRTSADSDLNSREFIRRLDAVFDQWLASPGEARKALTINLVSQQMNLSSRSLQRKIREATNMEYRQYKQQYMLEQSLDMLLQDLPIGEIANLLNYSSQSHFTHLFKSRFGFTPTQYRKRKL